MNHQQTALWQRIREFAVDDPSSSFTFTARLARENGWSRGFAHRVVDEYRRFVFLAMVTGHDVTPSEQVDEAWHLHLTYTHNYWEGLCRGILGRPLHHVPTRGGPEEGVRHVDQYNQTLGSYQVWFGHSAPSDIWPPAAIRFGDDLQHVRVNRSRSWIIPKPNLWRTPRRLAPWVTAAAIPPVLWGIGNPFDMQGDDFLAFFAIVVLLALVVAFALRQALRIDEPAEDERPLAPHEIACLGRGATGVLQTCLAGLVARHELDVTETAPSKIGPVSVGNPIYAMRATSHSDPAANPVERIMLATAGVTEGADPAAILKAAKPVAEAVESDLQSRGLLESNTSFGPARWWPLLILGGVFVLGFLKMCVGISRDRPVGFLIFALIALAFAMFFFARKPRRTFRGDRLFNELKRKHEQLKSANFANTSALGPTDLMVAAGLFGLMAIDHPDIRQLNSALKPVAAGDGGFAGGCGASGGGDGGGGDGGGGGCGGCGGGGCGGGGS